MPSVEEAPCKALGFCEGCWDLERLGIQWDLVWEGGGLIRQTDKRDSLKAYRCIGNVWLGICSHLPQAHASLHGSEKGVKLQERFQFGKDSSPPDQLDS